MWGSRRRATAVALGAVLTIWLAMAIVVLLARPPWEAPDEPAHVQNIEAIVRGRLPRMVQGSGQEAMQPPAYYALEAAWQVVAGVRPIDPHPVLDQTCGHSVFLRARFHQAMPLCWFLRHGSSTDRHERSIVRVLRVPGLMLGVLTLLLTAMSARRLTDDRWTPVVAAAIVAGATTFLLDSASVNNDVLAVTLSGLATLLAVELVGRGSSISRRRALVLAGALGATFAALVQTKLTTLCLFPGILLAILSVPGCRRVLVGGFSFSVLVVAGWWMVRNTSLYGDPLALARTDSYNHLVASPLEYANVRPLHRAFVELPALAFKQIWFYFQQFDWPFWAYLPLWGLSALGLASLGARRHGGPAGLQVRVLALLALSGLAALWAVGVQDNAASGRLALIGLPAFACLVALGFERFTVPIVRFALPTFGFAGSVWAISSYVLSIPG